MKAITLLNDLILPATVWDEERQTRKLTPEAAKTAVLAMCKAMPAHLRESLRVVTLGPDQPSIPCMLGDGGFSEITVTPQPYCTAQILYPEILESSSQNTLLSYIGAAGWRDSVVGGLGQLVDRTPPDAFIDVPRNVTLPVFAAELHKSANQKGVNQLLLAGYHDKRSYALTAPPKTACLVVMQDMPVRILEEKTLLNPNGPQSARLDVEISLDLVVEPQAVAEGKVKLYRGSL